VSVVLNALLVFTGTLPKLSLVGSPRRLATRAPCACASSRWPFPRFERMSWRALGGLDCECAAVRAAGIWMLATVGAASAGFVLDSAP